MSNDYGWPRSTTIYDQTNYHRKRNSISILLINGTSTTTSTTTESWFDYHRPQDVIKSRFSIDFNTNHHKSNNSRLQEKKTISDFNEISLETFDKNDDRQNNSVTNSDQNSTTITTTIPTTSPSPPAPTSTTSPPITTTPYSSFAHPDVILAFTLIIFYAVFVLFILIIVIRIIVTICTTRTSFKVHHSSENTNGCTFSDPESGSRTYSLGATTTAIDGYRRDDCGTGNKHRHHQRHRMFLQSDMTSFMIGDRTNSPSMIDYTTTYDGDEDDRSTLGS